MESNLDILNQKLDFLIESLGTQKEVFSASDAAEYLCISYDALLRYAKIGQIKYASNGNSKIFKKAWLDEWLESGGTNIRG